MKKVLAHVFYHFKIVIIVFGLFGLLTFVSFQVARFSGPSLQANVFDQDIGCFYETGDGEMVECGEEGCIYPDGSFCTNTECSSDFSGGWDVDWSMCLDEDGLIQGLGLSDNPPILETDDFFDNELFIAEESEEYSRRRLEPEEDEELEIEGEQCDVYYNENGAYCTICLDDAGKVLSDKCAEKEEKEEMKIAASPGDAYDQIKKMDRLLSAAGDDGWKFLEKRINRVTTNMRELKANVSEDFGEEINNSIGALGSILAEVGIVKGYANADIEAAKLLLEKIDPGNVSDEELNKAWDAISKLKIYFILQDAVGLRLMTEELLGGPWKIQAEISKLEEEMGSTAGDFSELLADLKDLTSHRADMKEVYNQALAEALRIRALIDPNEVKTALEKLDEDLAADIKRMKLDLKNDFETFWKENPWALVDKAWSDDHIKRLGELLVGEIGEMQRELGVLEGIIDEAEGLNIEDLRFNQSLTNLRAIKESAESALTRMQRAAEEGLDVESVTKFWKVIDRVSKAISKDMGHLAKYFNDNGDEFEQLSGETQRLFSEFTSKWKNVGLNVDVRKTYEDLSDAELRNLEAGIDEESRAAVIRSVNPELMRKTAPFLSEDVIQNLLNNVEIFGTKADRLLANTAEVFERMEDLNGSELSGKLRELMARTHKSLIVSSLKDELGLSWERVQSAMEAGDRDVLAELTAKIEELLNDNDREAVFGAESYRFTDTPPGEWFFGSVMEMKEAGIVSGYRGEDGNLSGEFGSNNNVTVAEALKMALEAAEVTVLPEGATEGAHWAVAAGYVRAAEGLGIGALIDLKTLDRFATREEVAVIVAEAWNFPHEAQYQGVFDDYDGDFGGHIQAVYDADIFTGEGESGNFNGDIEINRAAMAKVIKFAIEAGLNANLIEDLQNFAVKS